MQQAPNYLSRYADIWQNSPRDAGLAWFSSAKYGLFIHYGLYSMLGRHEWVQFLERIPVAEYARLADEFTAERFDARWWADFAVSCGMRYINITTRHHDSFCLWDTEQTDFKSTNTPCRRDLIAELADACAERGLGLCLYYSHGRDWRHPHAPDNDTHDGAARPVYDPPEPTYAYGENHDLQKYVDFMTAQITELLTGYGPIAAVWLDGIGVPMYPRDADGKTRSDFDPRREGDPFHCQELYDQIHRLQPQCLVSYKEGYLHTEDFYSPEFRAVDHRGKPVEVCSTLMDRSWGHNTAQDGKHYDADRLWTMIQEAWGKECNLTINTGPLGDGSIHPEDEPALREVGRRLKAAGFVPIDSTGPSHGETDREQSR